MAPVITCSRLRMGTDGDGVTTLVCFHGCPLRCRHCINPFSLDPKTRYTRMTSRELYEKVRQDELYFLATGGGVTFGGGEPLLYPEFIRQFRELCGSDWQLRVETSLNVPWENAAPLADIIDRFYIDCKDTNPEIYRQYTGRDNAPMLSNLQKLLTLIGPDKLTLRLPLIPGYNTNRDRERSRELLEGMGVERFDLFTYRTC